jgi:hypothetical protein
LASVVSGRHFFEVEKHATFLKYFCGKSAEQDAERSGLVGKILQWLNRVLKSPYRDKKRTSAAKAAFEKTRLRHG